MSCTVSVTPEQRDALLFACDDDTEATDGPHPGIHAVLRAPTVAALADDLILPDADGNFQISVPREALVPFLEHQIQWTLECCVDGPLLQLWHTAVTLLDELGAVVEGSVYEGIVCSCEECAEQRGRVRENEEG